MQNHKNWAGNLDYHSKNLLQPETIEQIQGIVKDAKHVKTLGSRHCFNEIADCDETHISLKRMNKMLAVDEAEQTVTIDGGAQYSDFAEELHERGFALHNTASLANISVAGAAATATHGSGSQSLATAISEIEFVDGRGELVTLNRKDDPEKFPGVVVNLGALGIISKLKLNIEPAYYVRQDLFQNLSLNDLAPNFTEIMNGGDSVSLFTTFENKNINVVVIKRRCGDNTIDLPDTFFGATAAKEMINSRGIPDRLRSPQMGVSASWYECLPHFKFDKNLDRAPELQTEYFVETKHAVDAILALEEINTIFSAEILTSEIRTIKGDHLWLSPFYRGDSVGIHISWHADRQDVVMKKVLPEVERTLAPYDPLPHWGKLFTTPREVLHAAYPKTKDFIDLTNDFDPEGKFRNAFLNRYLF